MLHSQNYATMGYLPFTFVASHLLFGASGPKPRIRYPHEQFEKKQQRQKAVNLVNTMVSEMSPYARLFASPNTLVRTLIN